MARGESESELEMLRREVCILCCNNEYVEQDAAYPCSGAGANNSQSE